MYVPALQPGLAVNIDRAAVGDSIPENKASSMEAQATLFIVAG